MRQLVAGQDQAALVPLTPTISDVEAGLDRLTQESGTRIDLALDAARGELTGPARREGNNPVLILLTDGEPTGTTAVMRWEDLSSEEKLDAAYSAATEDMSPAYLAVLRQLRPGVGVQQAFCLWRMARDALYRQELGKGLAPDDAMRRAAQRLLQIDHDSTA